MDRSVKSGEYPDEQVVDDLEDGDEAEAHGEAEEAAGVGHEADEGDLLVALDPRDDGVADVDVDEGQVPTGVHEQLLADLHGRLFSDVVKFQVCNQFFRVIHQVSGLCWFNLHFECLIGIWLKWFGSWARWWITKSKKPKPTSTTR